MSYANHLKDRCDIYHMMDSAAGGQFGVPVSGQTTYATEPDKSEVKCLFAHRRTGQVQGDPNQTTVETYLVHFLVGTDVRLNDKVVFNSVAFVLESPNTIRGHHIEVKAVRSRTL